MARAITPVRGAPNVQWNCNPRLKSHAKSNKFTWNQEQKQLKNYQLPQNLLKTFRKSETFVKNFHEAAAPFKIIAPYPGPSSIKYRSTANLCFYPRKHCQSIFKNSFWWHNIEALVLNAQKSSSFETKKLRFFFPLYICYRICFSTYLRHFLTDFRFFNACVAVWSLCPEAILSPKTPRCQPAAWIKKNRS